MLFPGGDAIRAQLGDRYYLLPVPDGRIRHCKWCRRRMTPEQVDEIETKRWEDHVARSQIANPLPATGRPPLMALPCELREYWPAGVRMHATEGVGLPQPVLPDGRWVICIPPTKDFGNILPTEWRRIVAGARLARGPLINHAYERTLENLKEWRAIGRDVMRRYTQRSILLERRGYLDAGEDPFPDADNHLALMSWIQEWAGDLHAQDFPDFRPFEKARLALSRATGFEPRTIESIVQRHRGGAAGATKRPSTKMAIRRHSSTPKPQG